MQVQYNLVLYNVVQYNVVQYNLVLYNVVQYNVVQYNVVQYNVLQYGTTHCDPVHPSRRNSVDVTDAAMWQAMAPSSTGSTHEHSIGA